MDRPIYFNMVKVGGSKKKCAGPFPRSYNSCDAMQRTTPGICGTASYLYILEKKNRFVVCQYVLIRLTVN